MAIGVIGTNSTNSTSGTATSITVSHTVPSTDGNRMLIVVYWASSAEASSATFGAASMTEGSTHVGADHSADYVHFFWLANPATGTDTVTVNFASNTGNRAVGAVNLKDAKQTVPLNAQILTTSYPTNVTSKQSTISPTANNSLFFTLSDVGSGASALTQDTGQTEQINFQRVTGNVWCNLGTESGNTTSYVGGISWTTGALIEQHVWGILEDVAAVVAGGQPMSLLGVGG